MFTWAFLHAPNGSMVRKCSMNMAIQQQLPEHPLVTFFALHWHLPSSRRIRKRLSAYLSARLKLHRVEASGFLVMLLGLCAVRPEVHGTIYVCMCVCSICRVFISETSNWFTGADNIVLHTSIITFALTLTLITIQNKLLLTLRAIALSRVTSTSRHSAVLSHEGIFSLQLLAMYNRTRVLPVLKSLRYRMLRKQKQLMRMLEDCMPAMLNVIPRRAGPRVFGSK